MSIIRAPRPQGDFTILRNDVLRDTRLSYRARGILAAILSRPDTWRTDAASLAREGKEGRGAVLTALKELEVLGYLHRHRVRVERGRFRTVQVVFDEPRPKGEAPAIVPSLFDEPTGVQVSDFGQPDAGAPDAGGLDALGSTETKNSPLTPPPGGQPVEHNICRRHARPRRGCSDCCTPKPKTPAWCGECDPQGERDVGARMVTVVDGEGVERVGFCPRCHPSAVRRSA